MFGRILVTLTVLLTFIGISSAAEYVIRVDHNTNLRSQPSLDGGVVATTQSGSMLQVIGVEGRWLKINRGGTVAWMANWVGHSRVGDSATISNVQAPSAPQPTTPVDNCCQVDRNCQTEQDWTDGYWAFRNNECVAPVTNQAPASSVSNSSAAQQPSASPAAQPATAPANADNCCQLGWDCQSEDDWVRGFHAFRANQCSVPVDSSSSSSPVASGGGHPVHIEGSGAYVNKISQAFDLLRARVPYWYGFATSGLAKVTQHMIHSRAGVDVRSRTFHLDYHNQDALWIAGLLVHEACHVHRYNAGQNPGGVEGEKACTLQQLEAISSINPNSSHVQYLRKIIDKIDTEEGQWWR